MKKLEYSNEYVIELLKIINENLVKMDMFTDEIIMCSYDDIEENIGKRNLCFEKIKKYNSILTEFRNDKNIEFKNIMSGHADYDSLNSHLKIIYDERRKMNALLSKVISKDDILNQKISQCRDEMLKRIKSLNSGNEAKASKYHAYASFANSNNIYIPKKNKQI